MNVYTIRLKRSGLFIEAQHGIIAADALAAIDAVYPNPLSCEEMTAIRETSQPVAVANWPLPVAEEALTNVG
jgi:hypothetical protein